MIEVKNLTKRFGKKTAVDNISFTVNKGEIVGFLGPNGAGKSTTMNMITGYLSSTSGSVLVDGVDILDDPNNVKKKIGFLPELIPLYMDMTVKEYLDFVYDLRKCKYPRKAHLNEICELVGIKEVYNRIIGNLSKGYKQRVGFAEALIGNPEILILDEPTVGFDPKQIIEIRNLIRRLGKNHTIILSSHILPEVSAVCERIIVINQGKIVADNTPENLASSLKEENGIVLTTTNSKEEIINAFADNENIKSIVLNSSSGEVNNFTIIGKENINVRKIVLLAVANNGINMIELKNTEMTLEDIFLQLVTKESEFADSPIKERNTSFDLFEKDNNNDENNNDIIESEDEE